MVDVDPCEVYLRYLPRTCDEARLRAQFEKCGRIVRARVAMDRDSGECKGYGFMTFSNKTEAKRCVREYNEHPRNYMDGKHAVITHATGSNPNKKPVAMCSFGVACRREDCHFQHPEGWDPNAEPVGADDDGDDDAGDDDGDGDDVGGGEDAPGDEPRGDKKSSKKDKKDKKDKRAAPATATSPPRSRGRATMPTTATSPRPRAWTRKQSPNSRGSSNSGSCSTKSARRTEGTSTNSAPRLGNAPGLARPKPPRQVAAAESKQRRDT